MIDGKQVLAIIPARGGSKGLTNKNILPLLGHPLVAYSIHAARSCAYIDRTIVSTDSNEIARLSRQYGAEVPFMRPTELATDHSRDLEVFIHAIEWLAIHQKYVPDIVVQLRPTSPVRFSHDLFNSIQQIASFEQADSLRAVTPSPITPYKMWQIDENDIAMKPLLHLPHVKEPYNEPRQNLPVIYWQTGTLDIMRRSTILNKRSMTGDIILPYIISNLYAVDIDDAASFAKAEELINKSNCIKFNV